MITAVCEILVHTTLLIGKNSQNPKIHANLLPAVVKSYMRSSLCNIIVVSVLVSGTHFLVQIAQQWTLHTRNDDCLDLDDLLCLGLLSAQKRLADTSECIMEGPYIRKTGGVIITSDHV